MPSLKKTIHNAIEGGKFMERRKLIAFFEAALEHSPDITFRQGLPMLLDTLKAIPAPQEYIEMQKFKLKHGISDGELETFLKNAIKNAEENK